MNNAQNSSPEGEKSTANSKVLSLTVVYSLIGSLLPLFYLFSIYSLTNSCAQQQPLTGGPRDTFPPNLIKELSTPNFQTNFEKQEIDLIFDEYIELRDVIKQVVVSPPLTYIPKVERIKGFKTARFKFDEKEELKEGVTYAINYGKSIRDLTEGNEVENLQFLFSTGDYIDSLQMSGTIVDALTGDPVEEVLFMLYENFADTVVRTEKPYYFGKTDKEGKFKIKYMKAGTFKGFALEDQDLNYLFNNPKERIGFTLDSIVVGTDSLENTVQIQIFEEDNPLNKPKVEAKQFGFVKMGFRRNPYDAQLTYDSIDQDLYKEIAGDTIRYWYNLTDSLDWNFYFQRDTLVDTLKIRGLNRNLIPLGLSRERKPEEKIPINPFKNLPITFNHPLKNIDTVLIRFSEVVILNTETDSVATTEKDTTATAKEKPVRVIITDSTAIIRDNAVTNNSVDTVPQNVEKELINLAGDFTIDSLIKRTIVLNFDWKENALYQLSFLPGALTDWYNEPNADTILLNYEVKPKSDFGTINLTITEMDSTKSYQFQLLLGTNEVKTFPVPNLTNYKTSFPALKPGKYSLKVIEDLDGNGRWSTGNYDKNLQPEKISTAEIEELRAGWDVDAKVKVDFSGKKEEETPQEDSN